MKTGIWFLSLAGMILLSASCSTTAETKPAEKVAGKQKAPQVKSTPEKKQTSSQVKSTPEKKQTSSAAKKRVMTAGEKLYQSALREKDPGKRSAAFRKACALLQKEILSSGKKDLRLHLLLAFAADFGLGMESNGILAAKHYRIAADGGLDEGRVALAEFWFRRRMFMEDAVLQLQKVSNWEKRPNVLHLLGAIRYYQRRYDEGFAQFKKLLALPRISPQYVRWVKKEIHTAYEFLLKAKDLDGAMRELERERFVDKDDAMIPYYMGRLEELRKRDGKAEAFFEQSVALNPTLPFAYRALGFLYVRNGKMEDALDHVKVAYAVSGKHDVMLQALIQVHLACKRQNDLERILERHQKGQKNNQNLRRFRSVLYLSLKKYEKSYREFSILLRDPKMAQNPDILQGMAAAATYTGKIAVAIRMYEKILEKKFQPVIGMNLAELYVVTDQYAKALVLLKHKGFQKENDPLAKCVLPYLEASSLLASGKTADGLIRAFEKNLPAYLKKNKGEWDVHLFIAWLKKNKTLSAQARKEILRMTELISGKRSLEKSPARTAKVPGKKSGSAGKKGSE